MSHPDLRRTAALMATISVLLSALALPAMAMAQATTGDPTAAQYDAATVNVQPGGGGGDAGASSGGGSGGGGTLPFTGLDIAALLAAAVALTGLGFALRRLSATPEH